MITPSSPLGRLALKGGALTGLSQAIKMGISFMSVVTLARLLKPEDFGLVASTAPLVAFVSLFQNLGLQQAIVQRPTIMEGHLNQIFWASMLAGLAGVLVVIALAPAAGVFYGDERVVTLMIWSAPPMLLGSLSSVPLSLLNRSLRFGSLALNEVLMAFSAYLTAVVAALLGFGYWSLVFASIASALICLLAAWLAAPYRPGRPTLRIDSDLLSFGANLTGFNLVNFFSRNLDNILIGRIAGLTPLGYYDRAYKLLLFPIQNVTQPLSRLMIPLLSRIQDDKPRFRSVYLRTNWVLGIVMMPGIAALTMSANEVVSIFFGERWAPVAPIFAWLGIASFAQIVSTTNGWIFMCQGRTKEMFQLGLWSSGTTILSFVVGLHWGVVGLAASYAITIYVLRLPALAYGIHRIGPVTAGDFLSIVVVFSVAALASLAVFLPLAEDLSLHGDMAVMASALVINYGLAFVCAFAYAPSRRMLMLTLFNVRDALIRRELMA